MFDKQEHRIYKKYGKDKITHNAIKEIKYALKNYSIWFDGDYDKKRWEENIYIKHYQKFLDDIGPVGIENWFGV